MASLAWPGATHQIAQSYRNVQRTGRPPAFWQKGKLRQLLATESQEERGKISAKKLKTKKESSLEPESNIPSFRGSPHPAGSHDDSLVYKVKRIDRLLAVDCGRSENEWITVDSLKIDQANSWEMEFKPRTSVKLCYNEEFIYLRYFVSDRYVRCLTTEPNGPVHKDACVEFFFSPTESVRRDYFNLEVNCCGTIKLGYRSEPAGNAVHATTEDINKIKVYHSLPGIIEDELVDPLEWTLNIALPFEVIDRYSPIIVPTAGTKWRANFYKCAENNSHPHWLSWAPITSARPNFHLPQFFGEIEFS